MSDSSQLEEIVIQGVPASSGVAIGKACVPPKINTVIDVSGIHDEMIPEHINRFKIAKQELCDHWTSLREKEKQEESKQILTAQIEIIADPELSEQVEIYIRNDHKNAQQAIKKAFSNYIKLLSESGSELMESRMIDLADIRDRLIEAAGNEKPEISQLEGEVLVADEISPREVIHFAHQNVSAFVTEKGGHASHAAIIARSMGIPAVVGAKEATRHINEDTTVCVDGQTGVVTINPSEETCEKVKVMGNAPYSQDENEEICKRPSATTDDYPFSILANLEFPEELEHADQFCAEGIGLLRTESVYLDQQEFGSVEKQVKFYEEFAKKMLDQPLTIRLFDVGGDKFREPGIVESNPFLGWRGIRMLLDERNVLREQLKAILIVANRYPGQVKILVPMVSSVSEIEEVKNEIEKCRQELADEGCAVEEKLPVGIMIEIPSAAIHASYFARKVDFFSIGTNDLTQYLLAVDRGNALISSLYDQRHPAVWQVIKHVIEAAGEQEMEVEVCGELASYPVAASCLVGMGVSTLSMSPISIPQVKNLLTSRSFTDMQSLADQVLQCEGIEEVRTLFNKWEENDG